MSLELFPVVQPEAAPVETELPLCREVQWDYERNLPVFRQGEPVTVEGAEAVAVWAWLALHTPRFRHEIYSWAFGTELENLIGQPYTEALKQAEAQRYVREALEINPYISGVEEIKVDFADGTLSIACTVRTVYGTREVSAVV